MSREELFLTMRASKEINQIGNDDSPYWQRAFELFEKSGGGVVDMDCGGCWNKVRDWLMATEIK